MQHEPLGLAGCAQCNIKPQRKLHGWQHRVVGIAPKRQSSRTTPEKKKGDTPRTTASDAAACPLGPRKSFLAGTLSWDEIFSKCGGGLKPYGYGITRFPRHQPSLYYMEHSMNTLSHYMYRIIRKTRIPRLPGPLLNCRCQGCLLRPHPPQSLDAPSGDGIGIPLQSSWCRQEASKRSYFYADVECASTRARRAECICGRTACARATTRKRPVRRNQRSEDPCLRRAYRLRLDGRQA